MGKARYTWWLDEDFKDEDERGAQECLRLALTVRGEDERAEEDLLALLLRCLCSTEEEEDNRSWSLEWWPSGDSKNWLWLVGEGGAERASSGEREEGEREVGER